MFRKKEKVEYVKVRKSDLEKMANEMRMINEEVEDVRDAIYQLEHTGDCKLTGLVMSYGYISGHSAYWENIIRNDYLK